MGQLNNGIVVRDNIRVEPKLLQGISEYARFNSGIWSVDQKNKSLSKFGRRETLNTTETTIADFDTSNNIKEENLLTTNGITHISSSNNTTDIGQVIKIEYHTINAGGDELTFGVQSVVLNGQTIVPLPVPAARVSRMYNSSGTEIVGDIYAHEGNATAGVPVAGEIHARIVAGYQQTTKCATSISNVDIMLVTSITTSVLDIQGATNLEAEFQIQTKALDGVWLPKFEWACSNSGTASFHVDVDPVIIVPQNHDVRILGHTTTGSATVTASFGGYLAILDSR